eukprot:5759572-Prymnesium_polylepis.1
MRAGAHMSVGSAPNCRDIVSATNRHGTNANLRPNGVLRSHSSISGRHSREHSPAAVSSVKRRRRDQGEQPDGRQFIDGRRAMSEASARHRRAALQWI